MTRMVPTQCYREETFGEPRSSTETELVFDLEKREISYSL